MNIWDPQWECADRKAIREHQFALLLENIKYIYKRVPYYRKKMQEKGLTPSDITSLEELRLLPFTTKQDFMDNYPFGMFAVPLREVVRVHGSSGTTTGKSTIVGYTRQDLDTWAELCARVAVAGGVSSDDIAQICFGYGLFTGGFGMHFGIEKIGALVLPISSGGTERQIRFIQDFGSTTLVSTPTYALHLAETARDIGVDLTGSSLRWGLFGGEPCSDHAQHEIDKQLGITATDNYGLSELIGPGISGECLERNGLHINEDHFIVEVIDPDTGEPLPPGEVGELVVSTLTKEAVPLLRYRTRDLSVLEMAPCRCGRTNARMEKVRGRTDDMLIIKGVNVFPSQIEDILLQVEHTEPHYQIIVFKDGALDALEVQVEVTEEMFTDEMKMLKGKEDEIRHRLKSELGIDCKVKLVEPKSLQRYTGKAQRVIDKRNKQ